MNELTDEGVVKSGVMSDEEVESMILKDFIANSGLICIDAGDIKMIRDNSDFMDLTAEEVTYIQENAKKLFAE